MKFFRSLFPPLIHFFRKAGPVKTAAVAFALLAVFILIVEKPGSGSAEKIKESQPLLFSRLSPETITHVTVTVPGVVPISLRHTADGWTSDSTGLSSESAAEFVQVLLDQKKEAVVSVNPSRQSGFAVDSEAGIRVQIWKDSRELEHFYFGKAAGANSQYFRFEGEDEVLSTTPSVLQLLSVIATDSSIPR